MDLGEAMIVAGIGCRKGAAAAAIEAAIEAALTRAGLAADALALIATSEAKGNEVGITDAAARLGVPLVLLTQSDLEAAGNRAETRSERVVALTGVPSLAEVAALAAAGPAAKLLARRIAVGPATCALAGTEGLS
jgi:cobalt-precorrin 5A hydrolase